MKADQAIVAAVPDLVAGGNLTITKSENIYSIIHYDTISAAKLDAALAPLPPDEKATIGKQIETVRAKSTQRALADMAVFPAIMLVAYLALFLYFRLQSPRTHRPRLQRPRKRIHRRRGRLGG